MKNNLEMDCLENERYTTTHPLLTSMTKHKKQLRLDEYFFFYYVLKRVVHST